MVINLRCEGAPIWRLVARVVKPRVSEPGNTRKLHVLQRRLEGLLGGRIQNMNAAPVAARFGLRVGAESSGL